jgi:hypothetical protein
VEDTRGPRNGKTTEEVTNAVPAMAGSVAEDVRVLTEMTTRE